VSRGGRVGNQGGGVRMSASKQGQAATVGTQRAWARGGPKAAMHRGRAKTDSVMGTSSKGQACVSAFSFDRNSGGRLHHLPIPHSQRQGSPGGYETPVPLSRRAQTKRKHAPRRVSWPRGACWVSRRSGSCSCVVSIE